MLTVTFKLGLPKLALSLAPQDVERVVYDAALSVKTEVKKSLRAMAIKTNSRKFWGDAYESVEGPHVEGKKVYVAITKVGVRAHWKGAVIKPTGRISEVTGKPTTSLLIPFEESPLRRSSLAAQNLPEEDVKVLISQQGKPYLAYVRPLKKGEKKPLVRPLGWFAKQVKLTEKPEVMPTDEALLQGACKAAETTMRRILSAKN